MTSQASLLAQLFGSSEVSQLEDEDKVSDSDDGLDTHPSPSPGARRLENTTDDLLNLLPSMRSQQPPRCASTLLPPPPMDPISDDGFIYTSPLHGKSKDRAKQMREKTAKKKAVAKEQEEAEEEKSVEEKCKEALSLLKTQGVDFGELCDYVFDPSRQQGNTRYHEFLIKPGRVAQTLTWWMKTPSTRKEIEEWALENVKGRVNKEAACLTKERDLKAELTPSLIKRFSFRGLGEIIREKAPVMMSVIESFSTSARQQRRSLGPVRLARKFLTQTLAASTLLAQFSMKNMLVKRYFGLFLYGRGAQRQIIAALSHIGLCESYPSLVRKGDQPDSTPAATAHPSSPLPPSSPMPSSPIRPVAEAEDLPSDDPADPTYEPESSESEDSEDEDTPKKHGTLYGLSQSLRDRVRAVVARGDFGAVFDNINFMARIAQQIAGRKDTQENGTTYTIFRLHKAEEEDMDLEKSNAKFNEADPLTPEDLEHNEKEDELFQQCMVHCILRIAVQHGGEIFKKKFNNLLMQSLPASNHKIAVHTTEVFPAPTKPIDESSVTGMIDVDEAFVKELQMRETSWWMKLVRFIGGDQLSIVRLRSIFNLRAGKEGGYSGFGWGIWMTGLFHAKLADNHGFMLTHYGKSGGSGTENPASLAFHNTLLQRLPITLSSMPPFRTCRDLVFVSLYARVLHLFLVVSGEDSMEAYGKKVKWDTFKAHAELIYSTYCDASAVQELRDDCKNEEESRLSRPVLAKKTMPPQQQPGSQGGKKGKKGKKGAKNGNGDKAATQQPAHTEGDMVYENAVLFLRDALITREFADAVKVGDSGRVILVLKLWAMAFRGNGRTKYAYEMFHLIHNLTHVWTREIRCVSYLLQYKDSVPSKREIVLNNWLLNLRGKVDSFVEMDLVQEHLNFWIKRIYKAHGSNSTWEWLEMISPCVEVLRDIAANMNVSIGEASQGSRHTNPDLSKDIGILMTSLAYHNVYMIQKGRVLADDDPPVKDVLLEGSLAIEGPLQEYNAAFKQLQVRRRIEPVVGGLDPGIRGASSDSTDAPTSEDVLEDPFQGEMAEVFGHDEPYDQLFSLENPEDVSLDMDSLDGE